MANSKGKQNDVATQALGQLVVPSSSAPLIDNLKDLSQSLDSILSDTYQAVSELVKDQKATVKAEMTAATNIPTNTVRSDEMYRMYDSLLKTIRTNEQLNERQNELFKEIKEVRLLGPVVTPTTDSTPPDPKLQEVTEIIDKFIQGIQDMRLHAIQAASVLSVPTTSSSAGDTAKLADMLEKLITTSQELIQRNRDLKENIVDQAANLTKRPRA